MIFTLGLTETWVSKQRKLVAASNQVEFQGLPNDFAFHVSTVAENLDNLVSAYEVLKAHNSNLKILITVSPVHLRATYRKDADVMSASCLSKSVLRVVAEEFCQLPDVYYFPSYEIATVAALYQNVDAFPDNHHVSQNVVDTIMRIFAHNCVQAEGAPD